MDAFFCLSVLSFLSFLMPGAWMSLHHSHQTLQPLDAMAWKRDESSERHFVLLSFVRSVVEGWALQNLSMQGSESEIRVAVTATNPALRQTFESHIGIVGKADLLNVALTRAKSGLVIVGNRTILSEGSEDFFQLASDLCDRGNLVSAAEFKAGHVRLAH
ncbi:unnamed protein product [Cladocopium goreaui]|uniref:Regulator of nonsense transcripts 1-like n=1 Tax=Cladocopium goreaui TaxID=2562237 RepID=A0A9P1BMJ7_9DINO|nr:unnamed protein product [Cladocopium goreaui]